MDEMMHEEYVKLQIRIKKEYYDQLCAKKGTERTWVEFIMKEIFFIDIRNDDKKD